MKTACQVVILVLLALGFFRSLYQDFYGIKAHEPWGFNGVIVTVLVSPLVWALYWYAGTFTGLLGAP